MKRVLPVALLFVLAAVRLPPPVAASATGVRTALRIDPALAARLRPPTADQPIRVIVHLASPADHSGPHTAPAAEIETRLRRRAATSQAPMLEWLHAYEAEGRVNDVTSFWVFNGLALAATPEVIRALAARPEVERITLDYVILAAHRSRAAPAPVEANLKLIGAPEAWARGVTGQGVLVALLDTGVDVTHPDLAARWRGGANSWFDPSGEHPDAPIDVDGHGTQVLGVILGGDAGGSRIGVAPDAQWMAAKIFDDRGRATVSGIHRALQWVLDPDGDPATADAPRVLNNSWSSAGAPCDLEFSEDLRALRAAGILPVFAAGVNAPVSPADLSEALAVGALAEDGETLHFDSAHGPSSCSGDAAIYPQVVAPGANIRTTDRSGLYTTLDGTSLAAAHVSGALALLLSADPSLSADGQASILTETAVDLGERGPDNEFGYGRIDIGAALERVRPGPQPSPFVLTGVLALLLIGVAIMARARRA